jgi:hypothetical protein
LSRPQGETIPPVRTFESRKRRTLRCPVTSRDGFENGARRRCLVASSVASRVNAIAGLGERRKHVARGQPCGGQARAHLLTQLFKALLFRYQDETVPQAQDCKRRTDSQPKILAELLGNSKPALLADLGRSQVFERGIVAASYRTGGMFCIETRFRPALFIF